MMKKGFMAVAMVCMLSAASVMCVHAEEAQTETADVEMSVPVSALEWDENLQQMFVDEGFSGTFYDIDALGMRMLVPEGMEKRQPTDEEKEKDIILVFENEEKDQKIELTLGPVSDCETLDEVKAFIEENAAGVTVNPTKINGLDTLVYGSEEADSMSVMIGAGDAGFLRVICRPVKDAQMNKLYSYVAASIQQIEE